MKSRALASIALGAAVLLGTAGCSMISPQATTIAYSAAEGINVPDTTAPIKVRNAFLVVSKDDPKLANLVAVFVNDGDEAASMLVQIDGVGRTVKLDAHQQLSTGINGDNFEITGDFAVGATAKGTFQTDSGAPASVELPVLNGDLDYLTGSVPTPQATTETTK